MYKMLCKLPPEIWLSIFEYLQWPQHQLASMVSISPYTKEIVEAILYREPRIGFSLQRTRISHLVEQFHRTINKGDGRLADGVRTFSLSRLQRRPTRTAVPLDACLTAAFLLCMRNLKRLEVVYHGAILIPPIVDPSDRFISITHLCWFSEVNNAVSFAAFLGSLPSLEYMTAGGDGMGFIPLAPTALPLLRHLDNASLNFAKSVLTGRHVPHLGLATDDFEPLFPILDGDIGPTVLNAMKCVESLSMTSEVIDSLTLMECASMFREMKNLKIYSEDPLETLAMLETSAARLCETKIISLELRAVCDDDVESDIESMRQLFSTIPSLKVFDFKRVNDDIKDGSYRFCRDKLDDGPEWIEGEHSEVITEYDQWRIWRKSSW
ncbi:hypothetical protein CCMSSC00406_0006353 [Pleurotus cornucopiae]|uniref:Uncharacterized protein n=1 Tax=Pleurotus cornucopiae TaxID=5321 RepID=A0ACB7IRZ0_PLECO|nr:hypothetical protein CCMSSC00406_0006353 [Pleurotus cornucopiae]